MSTEMPKLVVCVLCCCRQCVSIKVRPDLYAPIKLNQYVNNVQNFKYRISHRKTPRCLRDHRFSLSVFSSLPSDVEPLRSAEGHSCRLRMAFASLPCRQESQHVAEFYAQDVNGCKIWDFQVGLEGQRYAEPSLPLSLLLKGGFASRPSCGNQ